MSDNGINIAHSEPDLKKLTLMIVVRIGLFITILGVILFLTAGTLQYWEAWIYLGLISVSAIGVVRYFLKKDPKLLERRMRTRERERAQKTIQKLGIVIFAGIFLLPGFDKRHEWSFVPVPVFVAADAMVLLGYFLFVRVLQENRYASRIVEVDADQQLVTTGPYAVVRHPMYVGILLIYLFSPLALGSYWGMIASLGLIGLLVARILNEENVLLRELPGFKDYTRQTRYRLIPGIW